MRPRQAAFTMAWHRPDLYRRVAAFSGSFVNLQYPYSPETPLGCWEYHGGKQLIKAAAKSWGGPMSRLRVALYSMEEDFGNELPAETYHNWTLASHRMASELKKREQDVLHVHCRGAVHTDNRVFAQELPDVLEWLWCPIHTEESVDRGRNLPFVATKHARANLHAHQNN